MMKLVKSLLLLEVEISVMNFFQAKFKWKTVFHDETESFSVAWNDLFSSIFYRKCKSKSNLLKA